MREVSDSTYGIQGDVASLEDLSRMYEIIGSEQEYLGVVFANAGGGEFAPLGAITAEHYDRTFDINMKGTLFTVQKALPLLRDGSSVILTGSTAASTGIPAFSVYGATKAAIRSFARNWILDLAPRGIRVNILAPGATSTPGWHDMGGNESGDDAYDNRGHYPRPHGEAREIANAALFLASDESSFIGCELFADGVSAQMTCKKSIWLRGLTVRPRGRPWTASEYLRMTEPILARFGARILFRGGGLDVLATAPVEGWDAVLLVQYPRQTAFRECWKTPSTRRHSKWESRPLQTSSYSL